MSRRSFLTVLGSLAAALVIAVIAFLITTDSGESPSPDGPQAPPDLTGDEESRVVDLTVAITGAPRDWLRLISATPVIWSNTCLDIERPDTMCGQALVPGYRLTIGYELNGQRQAVTHEFHTDEQLSMLLWQASDEAEGVVASLNATSIVLRGSGGVFDRGLERGSLEFIIAPGTDFLVPRTDLAPGDRVRFGFDPRPSADVGVLVWIASTTP